MQFNETGNPEVVEAAQACGHMLQVARRTLGRAGLAGLVAEELARPCQSCTRRSAEPLWWLGA